MSEHGLLADWLGSATISPETPVKAGSFGTWRITYTVGRSAIDDGGRLQLAFRSVSDHSEPQVGNPGAEGYVSVSSTGHATLTASIARDGVRPWTRLIAIRVSEGQLAEGDVVTVVIGNQAFGSPGIRTQTFPERNFNFKLMVDPFGTKLFREVADLGYEITGGDATHLVVTGPSDVVAGKESWLHVRALDVWGNPDPDFTGTLRFAGNVPDGLPAIYQFGSSDGGVHRFDGVRYQGDGAVVVTATDDANGFTGESNPIRVHPGQPALRVYWGDLHGQTRETVGTGSIEDYFRYARDVAAVDACAHSGNDFQITGDVYAELRKQSQQFYESGRFVTFHGYEWSGNTPAGGDHNVYYLDNGPIRRSSHAQVEDLSDLDSDCYPIDRLYAANAGRQDVMITPHIGGRRANLDYHDPSLEPAIEIASQWGRFEWFALDAIERGLKVGFIGGSDDHSGRPGWSAPTLAHHGVRGGLTAYLAPELTRDAIWEALRSRQVYGTSGPRILLDVSIGGHPMGSEITISGPPTIRVNVTGTADLDTVELRRGVETIHQESLLPAPEQDEPWRIRIAWRGARNRDRSRALNWTGGVQLSGGTILQAKNWAIDSPLDGVSLVESDRVTWRSHTCGDWDGVILDLDGDLDTVLRFRTPAINFDRRLSDLVDGPVRHEGGLLEQQVVVQRLSKRPGSRSTAFEFEDTTSGPGVHPYWIWVTQADGELAWSSPIWATRT